MDFDWNLDGLGKRDQRFDHTSTPGTLRYWRAAVLARCGIGTLLTSPWLPMFEMVRICVERGMTNRNAFPSNRRESRGEAVDAPIPFDFIALCFCCFVGIGRCWKRTTRNGIFKAYLRQFQNF